MGGAPNNKSATTWTVSWSLHLTVRFIVYWFGGYDGMSDYYCSLHRLDSTTLEWRELQPLNQADGPMRKAGCGMITVLQNQLATFGGHGFCTGPTQPGAMFTEDTNGKGWSNELHIFDITRGM